MCDGESLYSRARTVVVILVCSALICLALGQRSWAQTNHPARQSQRETITKDKNQSEASDRHDKKSGGGGLKIEESETVAKMPTDMAPGSAHQKEQFLRSTVEDVLIGAYRVNSVEHSILVQVEAATLLWDIDRDRANSVLRGVLEKFRGLLHKKEDPRVQSASAAERERLRASILRKIARLNPSLIGELIVEKTDGDKSPAVVTDWTEEARAILAFAYEEINRNPALAAKLAEKSLSFGTVGLPNFLIALARRDRQLAEQEGMILLSRLGDSSVQPLFLLGFSRFVFFDDKVSAQLRNHFFQSLLIRIRRDVRPDLDSGYAEDLLNALRGAAQTAKASPRWQAEFAQTISDIEALLAARSLPVPGPSRPITVGMPKMATEGDTREIAEAAERVQNIKDSRTRDKEYKKLAVSAAEKADLKLAENLVSKIEGEEGRQKASIEIYSPFVRRALAESDWLAARTYALELTDPLGRSLVIDWVAQKMTGANQSKELVKELYDAALERLRHDSHTRDVALGFIVLSRSIFAIDRAAGFDAMRWAVYVINKAADARISSSAPELAGELGTWVRREGPALSPEESLDITEMIGPAFNLMGTKDINEALVLSSTFSDLGLSLVAKLGVVRAVAEEIRNSKKLSKDGKKTSSND